MKIFYVVIVMLLFACTIAGIGRQMKDIDESVKSIKLVVLENKNKLEPVEQEQLLEAYHAWQNIKDSLVEHGCGVALLSKEVCSLDVSTIQYLHRLGKEQYFKVKAVALAHWADLKPTEKLMVKEFDKKAQELDKALREFEQNPNEEEKELNFIRATSGLAVVASKVVPILMEILG